MPVMKPVFDEPKPYKPLKSIMRCSVTGHVRSRLGDYCIIDGWELPPLNKIRGK